MKLRRFFYWQGIIRRHEINAAKKCADRSASVRTECLKPDAMIQIRGCQIFIGEGTSERTLQTVLRAFDV